MQHASCICCNYFSIIFFLLLLSFLMMDCMAQGRIYMNYHSTLIVKWSTDYASQIENCIETSVMFLIKQDIKRKSDVEVMAGPGLSRWTLFFRIGCGWPNDLLISLLSTSALSKTGNPCLCASSTIILLNWLIQRSTLGINVIPVVVINTWVALPCLE